MPRLKLADLIDLELQLERDKHADVDSLRRRDAQIGEKIGANQLAGRPLFLAWLAEIRVSADTASTGIRFSRLAEFVGTLLFVVGLVFGVSAVAPWLAYHTERPVNVIFFWSSLIGVQLLLLLGWLLAICPKRWLAWLPGVSALQLLFRGLGRLLPSLVTWIAARCSSEIRDAVRAVRGQARRLEWLYGRLAVWKLVNLTQSFAVAFNVGAIGAFLAISYGTDPSFGWKSTLLTDEMLYRSVNVISLPWSGWTEAVPTREQIRATRYSSLDERFEPGGPDTSPEVARRWAAWWPFLLASLLVYGLAPRMVTWLISLFSIRRALARARLDHHEFQKLADRLRRPFVDTRASTSESLPDDRFAGGGSAAASEHLQFDGASTLVFVWAGVDLDRAELEQILGSRFGIAVEDLLRVGQLDEEGDAAAVRRLASNGSRRHVVLVVEAWEPPVADYVDFIHRLRGAGGDSVQIIVLLFQRDVAGTPVPPEESDLRVWSKTLASVGDPYLAVEPLLEYAGAAASRADGDDASGSGADAAGERSQEGGS